MGLTRCYVCNNMGSINYFVGMMYPLCLIHLVQASQFVYSHPVYQRWEGEQFKSTGKLVEAISTRPQEYRECISCPRELIDAVAGWMRTKFTECEKARTCQRRNRFGRVVHAVLQHFRR